MEGIRGQGDVAASLVRGGPLYKLLVRIRVIPPGQLAIGRRILLAWAVTIVPVLILVLAGGQPAPGVRDFSVYARLLIAIPILIIAEVLAERSAGWFGDDLRASGILREEEAPRFRAAVRTMERLRDSWLVFALIVAATAAAVFDRLRPPAEWYEVSWAVLSRDGSASLSAAGGWYVIAGYGLFLLLAILWLWRLALLTFLYIRTARLNLALVPTHPDRAGGIGFAQRSAFAFALAALAISVVVSARWGYDILYRGARVSTLETSIATLMAILVAIVICPLFAFAPALIRLKVQGLREYSALVARHGRLVDDKWIRGRDVSGSDLLRSPELGPVADVRTLFQGLQGIRPVPLNPRALVAIIVIIFLPIIPVLIAEIPLKVILGRIMRSI